MGSSSAARCRGIRLLAVRFCIVERAREIAVRKSRSERAEGAIVRFLIDSGSLHTVILFYVTIGFKWFIDGFRLMSAREITQLKQSLLTPV